MREARFHCPNLTAGVVTLDADQSRHARSSLRLRSGDTVTLFDGEGQVARGTLQAEPPEGTAADGRGRSLARVVVERVDRAPLPPCRLTLVVAACKEPRLKWMVEKCTELGVSQLVLADFARSVVRAGAAHEQKLRRTTIEACKQCGRARLPDIECGQRLELLIEAGFSPPLLVAHPSDDGENLGAWLAREAHEASDITAVIGPEGGLTPAELDALQAGGGRFVRLADHVLRVETAAVAFAASWAAHSTSR